jgi:hypothetical protein
MSDLASIITALAAQAVTVPLTKAYGANKTPQAFRLETVPNTVENAKLPCRLIRTLSAQQGGGQFQLVWPQGGPALVEWRLYDLLLWRGVEAGPGIGSHEYDLVHYVDAYTAMLQSFREPTSRSQLFGIQNIAMSVFEYPETAGLFYAGVEISLTIRERLKA